MAVISDSIPKELREKVPPLVIMFHDYRSLLTLFGIGLSVFLLIGPLVGPTDHNGLRYLIAALVCPVICASYFAVIPFNPYRGFSARIAGMEGKDRHDEQAKLLAEVFRSPPARGALLWAAMRISGVQFVIMVIIMVILRDSLNWSVLSPWLGEGLFGCCVGSLIAVGTEYISWGLRTWARNCTADQDGSI